MEDQIFTDFWPQLVERVRELEMQRPLYYTLTALQRMFNTKIPETVMRDIVQEQSMILIDVFMRYLIRQLIWNISRLYL